MAMSNPGAGKIIKVAWGGLNYPDPPPSVNFHLDLARLASKEVTIQLLKTNVFHSVASWSRCIMY